MEDKGFASGPFQLLIGVVVFGMALTIGGFLLDSMQCWKCNELLKIEATNLREAIASVGNGDINSRKNILVEIEDLGHCAKGIYLKKVTAAGNINCRSICPSHPNSCWVILTESSCGGKGIDLECIDISGDSLIEDPDNILGVISSAEPWLNDARAFSHSVSVSIEKTSPTEITINKPGTTTP